MKRRQAFEEGENDERRSRRLSQSSQSVDENFVVKKENTAADVNPSIYADYLKLDERYADLEMKYTEAMRQVAEFEQAKYEEEEFINRATEERDLAKKKAEEAIAEKEDAVKKMKDIELVNKNLSDDMAAIQEANEKIKQGSSDLEQQIASLQKELEDEKTKNAAANREDDLSALKLQYDAMKKEYEMRMKEHLEYKETTQKMIADGEKQRNEEMERFNEAAEKVEKLENELLDIQASIKAKKEEIIQIKSQFIDVQNQLAHEMAAREKQGEQVSKMEELQKQLAEMSDAQKSKDDQIAGLQKALDEMKQKFEDQKVAADQQSSEATTNADIYVSRINELLNAAKAKDVEIVQFVKQLAEVNHQLSNHKSQSKEASAKVGDLVTKISEYCNIVKEKDQQISELMMKLTTQQLLHDKEIEEKETKAGELVKDLEKQLSESRANLSIVQEKLLKFQNEFGNLQHQIENASQQCQKHTVEYQNMKAAREKIAAENVKIKNEKEKLEKEIVNLQNASTARISELEASINDRAKELLSEWKKKEKNAKVVKKERRQVNVAASSVDVKDAMIHDDDTVMENGQPQKNYQPKWIISEAECCDMYKSNKSKVSNFLQQYTSRLFNTAELMLPEEKLDEEKWNEAIAVLFSFWKPQNDGQKELCVKALQKKMNDRRYQTRSAAYKLCTSNRSVAFTSYGRKFYYSLHKYGIWKPTADKECQKILKFKKTHHSSFGIPTQIAAASEYILIIQDDPDDGQKKKKKKIYKLLPSGYIECIFKKANHHEKKNL